MPHALLKDELLARGYTCNEFTLDRLYKQYISPNGRVVLTRAKFYEYPFVSRMAKRISRDKVKSYAYASMNGVTVPSTLQTTDLEEAKQFLETHKRLIVKPADLGGGQGLTVNITDEAQLNDAISKATFNGNTPLIQKQFIGEEVRFTAIGGKVRSAILRRTPRVVGDGKSTVAELIKQENKLRESLVFPTLSYPQLSEKLISEDFLSSDKVLSDGEILEFSKATMIRNGASFYGILEAVHPSYIQIAERLASQLNPQFLVIDLMIERWDAPATSDSYVFLEFNTLPALEIFTSLRGGDMPDVIALIADLLDKYDQLAQ